MTLDGLTLEQSLIADKLWAMKSMQEVTTYLNTRPTDDARRDVLGVMELLKVASLDEQTGPECDISVSKLMLTSIGVKT